MFSTETTLHGVPLAIRYFPLVMRMPIDAGNDDVITHYGLQLSPTEATGLIGPPPLGIRIPLPRMTIGAPPIPRGIGPALNTYFIVIDD